MISRTLETIFLSNSRASTIKRVSTKRRSRSFVRESFSRGKAARASRSAQHVRTHVALGRRALQQGKCRSKPVSHVEAAFNAPENLGEAKHPLANQSDIHYWLGVALDAVGDSVAARESWERAAAHRGDFQLMRVTAFSELTFYSALALARLGNARRSPNDLLRGLVEYADSLRRQEPKIDYFATSLPQMLLFEDDARKRNDVRADFLEAQARIGLGDSVAGRNCSIA